MNMKFNINILVLLLMACSFRAYSQTPLDSLSVMPATAAEVGAEVFGNASAADVAKALYGRIAGLNVYQGSGSSTDNVCSISVHGRTPLVLVDGFQRDLSDLTALEIESVCLLSDAVSSALYGVRGGNGVVLVTTKRGNASSLNVDARYAYGLSTPFRKPEFADA